jgi:aromatic-L-amino-acid decarboxylase
MRVDDLERAIRGDRDRGLEPFLVVTSAGTTNTGAVDPLDAVADVCERKGLWHHVDGAYGAFFHMCPELRHLLRGLPRADSLTLDPHKGLFLPYGTGALLVRDGDALLAAHALSAGYLPPNRDPHEYYDPHLHGPELSRGFPGFRVWLTLKYYGAERLRNAIAEKRRLALDAASRIAAIQNIVLDAPPQLSLFAFHVEKPGSSVDEQNRATLALVREINYRGRVFLTGCWLGGRYLARVCVLSFRTHQEQIDACVKTIAEMLAGSSH